MRLVKVTGPTFYTHCCICGEQVAAGDGHYVYADLDGPAFQAYYCFGHAHAAVVKGDVDHAPYNQGKACRS